ncbi:MAG: SAM-dependent methyltransferase [Thermoplasmata archaeon]
MATGGPLATDPRLLAALAAAADPDGFLPFDRYMDRALYAEGVGYYARPSSPFGPAGDFYTAAEVHPLFAATIAGRIAEIRRRFPAERPFVLVEVGPGEGHLAAAIVNELGRSEGRAGPVSVVLIDRSPELLRRAVGRVRAVAEPLGTPVHARDSIGSLGVFEGVVLASELLDALPVRRVRRTDDGWVELGVRLLDGAVVPAESQSRRPVIGPPLPQHAPDGTVFEFSPAAEGLVREVADHLVRGALLIDDYGMDEGELLAGHPGGTLEGIRAHRSGWDPVEAPGATDLSAFVNFTRIRAVAEAAGLKVTYDRRQAEALGDWGFPQRFESAIRSAGNPEAEVRIRLAAKNLLFGFERFRILELEPAPAPDAPNA